MSFVLPLVLPTHILGADWGFDQLFCSVAKLYQAVTSPQFTLIRNSDLPEQILQSTTPRTPRSINGAPVGNPVKALQNLLMNKAHFKTIAADEKAIKEIHGAALAKERSVTQHTIRARLLAAVLESSVSVCAVITGAAAVHHDNEQVTNAVIGYDAKRLLNGRMMNTVQEAFPGFYRLGKGPNADPLHPESKLVKSETTQKKCVW